MKARIKFKWAKESDITYAECADYMYLDFCITASTEKESYWIADELCKELLNLLRPGDCGILGCPGIEKYEGYVQYADAISFKRPATEVTEEKKDIWKKLQEIKKTVLTQKTHNDIIKENSR